MAQKFPQVGLRAVFELTGFQRNYNQYQRDLRDIDRQTKQTAQSVSRSGQAMGAAVAGSLQDLIQQSQVLQDLSSMGLLGAGVMDQLRQAFDGLGEGVGVNIQQFDQLAATGISMSDAVGQAAQGLDDAAGAAAGLGAQFLTTAAAGATLIAAFRASIRLVQEAVSEYNELAEATRRLHYQTGLLTQEASSWVQVVQAAGVSTASAERALSMFLGRVGDLHREQQLGEESTSDFAQAMEVLGIDLENVDGNLKTTEQLLTDVNVAFQNLGPGMQSAQLAADLFGRTGRQLLPILVDQSQSLASYQATLEQFGATLTALDRQEYEEFLQAQFELRAALQGVYNFIARQWIPILTQLQRNAAAYVSIWRSVVQILSGTESVVRTVADVMGRWADMLERINGLLQRVAAAADRYRDVLTFWAPAARDVARAEEERAQAMAQAAQAATDARAAERARQEAIQETVEALDETRAQYIQKLTDIEQDAAQKWDAILVQRQRDAIDRARQEVYRLVDLQAAYNERLDSIEADFARRWDDILVKRQRDAIIRGIRLAQRYEDLARNAEQSRQDLLRSYADREVELRRDTQRRVEDAERDARRRREELEREHQRNLRDIQQGFLDTALEAARRNDAVAVARAQRQRAREIRDEQQRYQDEQTDLRDALERKRQDIERDRQQRESDHRRELARALQRIEENYARQREALVRQNQRERELREIRYRWELEDFEAAKAEQLQAAEDWHNKQLDAMKLAQAREELERKIQYDRQEKDFNDAWRRRLADAEEWYKKEREELARHLSLTGDQLEAIYADWARSAVEAVSAAVRAAVDSLASEITRYQHLLTEAERARARATVTPTQPPAGLPRGGEPIPYQVGPWPPGAPVLGMQEGGVVQASSPTHIVMGEGGPETGIFLPGGRGSLNVRHDFGRLGVDFQGLPGGMNTAQVQEIVYATMIQLAKGIQVPRA